MWLYMPSSFGGKARSEASTGQISPQNVLEIATLLGVRLGFGGAIAIDSCKPAFLLGSMVVTSLLEVGSNPFWPMGCNSSSEGVGVLLSVMTVSALVVGEAMVQKLESLLGWCYIFSYVCSLLRGWVKARGLKLHHWVHSVLPQVYTHVHDDNDLFLYQRQGWGPSWLSSSQPCAGLLTMDASALEMSSTGTGKQWRAWGAHWGNLCCFLEHAVLFNLLHTHWDKE